MQQESTVIRQLTREELFEAFTLSEFAFQYELRPEDKEERIRQQDPNQVWGAWIEGKLASKLTILNFITWLHGKPFAMGGIASVATWPEYRRQGLVRKLLQHAFKVMRDNGQTISFLHPFAFPFYRRFGYETYCEYRKYTIATAKLAGIFDAGSGRVERISLDPAILNPLYESFALRYNGMLQREDAYWHNRIFKAKKGTAAVYRNESGEPRGYVFYQVKDKLCTIHELVWLDEEARSGLWNFIAAHDSMMETVVVQAPSDDKLPFLLQDPRIAQETVPYFMARIVDASAFLAQYPFTEGGEQLFTLRLSDENAPWNDGCFELRISPSGRAAAEPLGESEAAKGLELACTIQTLTALMTGYQSASFLHEIGRLKGTPDTVGLLAARLPQRTTYLADYF